MKHVSGAPLALAIISAGLFALSAPVVSAEGLLSGPELDKTVSGRQIFLATPLGGEFPLNYRANGQVDGSGDAVGLGKFMQPKDSGRWWVQGEKLCQKWTNWYDGKVFCFTLRRTSPTQLAWKRDDGLEGTARIGR